MIPRREEENTKLQWKYKSISLSDSVTGFGESAPGEDVMAAYGFTVENVVKRAKALLEK